MSSTQDALNRWLEAAEDDVIPFVAGKAKNDQQTVIGASFARVCLWVEALAGLNETKHFQVHATAARSVSEILVDMRKVQSDAVSATACLDFTFVKRFNMAKRTVTFFKGAAANVDEYRMPPTFARPRMSNDGRS